MMTRETKVGIVVSCSFLCLVGVVLFSKLGEKGGTGTDAEAQAREDMTVPPEPTQMGSGAGALAQGPPPDPTQKETSTAQLVPAAIPSLIKPPSAFQQVGATTPEN